MATIKEKDFLKKKVTPRKPSWFSINWVYLIIIAGLLIFYFLKTNYTSEETTWAKFKAEMLLDHDVEKINIVNKEIVEVYIKKESLKKAKHNRVANNKGSSYNPGPHYYFTIGSIDFFEQQLNEAQANFDDKEKIEEVYVTRE